MANPGDSVMLAARVPVSWRCSSLLRSGPVLATSLRCAAGCTSSIR